MPARGVPRDLLPASDTAATGTSSGVRQPEPPGGLVTPQRTGRHWAARDAPGNDGMPRVTPRWRRLSGPSHGRTDSPGPQRRHPTMARSANGPSRQAALAGRPSRGTSGHAPLRWRPLCQLDSLIAGHARSRPCDVRLVDAESRSPWKPSRAPGSKCHGSRSGAECECCSKPEYLRGSDEQLSIEIARTRMQDHRPGVPDSIGSRTPDPDKPAGSHVQCCPLWIRNTLGFRLRICEI